ncbi:MAG TPA: Rne/Rng family ribonuclease [Marmoricola sp.]
MSQTPDENNQPTTAAAAPPAPPAAETAPSPAHATPPAVEPGEAPAKKAPAKKTAAKKAAKKAPAKKTAAKKAAALGEPGSADEPVETPAKKAAKKAPAKKAAAKAAAKPAGESADQSDAGAPEVLFQAPEKAPEKAPAKKAAKKAPAKKTAAKKAAAADETVETADSEATPAKKTAQKTAKKAPAKKAASGGGSSDESAPSEPNGENDQGGAEGEGGEGGEGGARRRRRRGGRRRGRKGGGGGGENAGGPESADDDASDTSDDDHESDEGGNGEGDSAGSRRRRTRNRTPKERNPEDEIASVSGSTRLEAKKQRRREGREAGRRRAPIVSEAEFLARREAVDRVMVIRQREDLTQIGVLEDKVLVEHYVSRASQTSMIGNVYLGRVQNVLPSMEAAFVDIGKGRNAVIYAGEVNWSALGHKDGQPRKIESVLQSGQTILVQVTKDPIGHKGARLTGQISLPGRFLVYVPDGTTSGISRKLPDTERNRLKTLLKQIVPDSAGVIVRTAAEGASEEELTRDVERLTARWSDIEEKVKAGQAPQLLYGEPDLTLKVVRDLFTEDFSKLVVDGADAWDLVDGYVSHVAPDLRERLERFEITENGKDVFATYRVDEQIAKGLDRKVWLPSGGSLIIDRTEAMTVVDVNTGKFTGSGGNLEETVTKNNLEAAEEIVRQLRLRDIGGIIVVDFIDMVLESNRDLVLRRLVECLGRDRTRHQVAEVTSLGLVQMTRKRIGTGLLEAFSEPCAACQGRGVVVHDHPVESAGSSATEDEPRNRRGRGGRGRGKGGDSSNTAKKEPAKPSPKDLAGSRPPAPEDASEEPSGEPSGKPADAPVEAAEEKPVEASPEASPEVSSEVSEPDDSVESPTAEPQTPPAPPAPTVVSSTRRRRSASRPAGPPVTVDTAAPADSTDGTDGVEPSVDAEDAENPDEPHVVHVPIKKKGARKR